MLRIEHAASCSPARRGLEPLITLCLARAQSIVIYAALQPPCSPFTMGTRRWRPLRAQTRLSGRGGNAECRSERSIPRRAACIATCVDFILIPFSFALNPYLLSGVKLHGLCPCAQALICGFWGRAGGGKKPCAVGCRGGGALLMAVLKGVHAQVPPHLILPCFRKVIGRATVRCWVRKK